MREYITIEQNEKVFQHKNILKFYNFFKKKEYNCFLGGNKYEKV